MVPDIAAAYGKPERLTRKHMLYTLFSHAAASAFRNLVVDVGERCLARRAPFSTLHAIGNKVALRIAQRGTGRLVTRRVRAIGALCVAGHVCVDTGHAADTNIELSSADVRIEGEAEVEGVDAMDDGKSSPKRAAKATQSKPSCASKGGAAGSSRSPAAWAGHRLPLPDAISRSRIPPSGSAAPGRVEPARLHRLRSVGARCSPMACSSSGQGQHESWLVHSTQNRFTTHSSTGVRLMLP